MPKNSPTTLDPTDLPPRTRRGNSSVPRAAWLIGPALVAGVAYLDPGNVASNMTAGAVYGYLLVWVVVHRQRDGVAHPVPLRQARHRHRPEPARDPRARRIRNPWARRAYWLQAELVAMATDIAEVIGGAVALYLLFGVPLLWGGVITGTVSIVLLLRAVPPRAEDVRVRRDRPDRHHRDRVHVGVFVAPPDAGRHRSAGLVPRFEDAGSVLLAASILGATIMPHAIYAHSALARDRFAPPPRPLSGDIGPGPRIPHRSTSCAASRPAAAAGDEVGRHDRDADRRHREPLHPAARRREPRRAFPAPTRLEGAYAALDAGLGPAVATLFAVGLLASGLASTSVGAYAGAEIMHGLLHVRIPLLARRLVTLIPALVILALGVDPTLALVLSQVVLSFGIPFALIPLVALTAQAERARAGTATAC